MNLFLTNYFLFFAIENQFISWKIKPKNYKYVSPISKNIRNKSSKNTILSHFPNSNPIKISINLIQSIFLIYKKSISSHHSSIKLPFDHTIFEDYITRQSKNSGAEIYEVDFAKSFFDARR